MWTDETPQENMLNMAIDEIKTLKQTVTKLRAERDRLTKALNMIRSWLRDPILSQWSYMEGSQFYIDLHEYCERIDSALASPPAAEEPKT